MTTGHLGLAGRIARSAMDAALTPLLLIAALVAGTLALLALPREEEPQISVPMVDILVSVDGLKAADAVELATKPLEAIVKGIDGVDHVYSMTEDDRVMVTARFKVGHDADAAILRVHEKIRANLNRIPLGVPEPLIIGRGINDVAILALTLRPKAGAPDRWDDIALRSLAEELRGEIAKVEDVGLTYLVGGRPAQLRIEPDPDRLALMGVTLNQLVDKLRDANRAFLAGAVRDRGEHLPAVAGRTFAGPSEIELLLLTTRDGRPVYVKDVADVVMSGRPDEVMVLDLRPDGHGQLTDTPAVTVAIAKRKGANAIAVAETALARLEALRARLIPADIDVTVTRDYGETAKDKADELLFHLVLASVTIVALLTLALGWREGLVVLVAIPTTILLTFLAALLMGYTINRVSLFALIFSIGILVDDAIVVVENIARHWREKGLADAVNRAAEAVDEVGNPTIVATFTIVVALLPMMFVSGLMGPYMSPIPANASAAMVFSLAVAFTMAPWLMRRLAPRRASAPDAAHEGEGRLGALYRRIATPLLASPARARDFLIAALAVTILSLGLFATKTVVVKLLPFDDKSELQVVVDLPPGTSLEATARLLGDAARRLASLPELDHIQLYAGTAAPFNFNGLVRHSYLRDKPHQGELQVNLAPKGKRERNSHAVALEVRGRLAGLALPEGGALKVVEVPPGPPVLATLLAEIYGPDAASRRAGAQEVRRAFAAVDFIVDIDDTLRAPGERVRFAIDRENLEFHRVEEVAVYDTLATLLAGRAVGYSHRGAGIHPIEIAVRLPRGALVPGERLLTTPVPTLTGGTVELGEVLRVGREPASPSIFRRDGRFAEMVMADLAGRYEAPIYGMLAVEDVLARAGSGLALRYHGQPEDESRPTLLWDGEWEITYVTFRDMGAAFIAAILGIYLLVVGQFRSFRLPLLVLLPVPLTLPGIVLGHWLTGAAFTATSMIGFIALAGIVVRNSILLIDFVQARRAAGDDATRAGLAAGAVRIKPILLTALAAMIGAAFILADPIFQGLAVSLLFGLASSTVLTVLAVPAAYAWLRGAALTAP